MGTLLFVYLGGVLSILSPCILPILPFVFARGDQPFRRTGLPLLIGLTITFAGVASLGALAGEWAVAANAVGRIAAFAVLALFGLTLLSERAATILARPAVLLGSRLAGSRQRSTFGGPLLIGIATGFLWAPCAGPILGVVLTSAVLQGGSIATSILLLTYAAGAATALAVALLAGGQVLGTLKRSLGLGVWIRRGLGAAVLGAVALIATGLDVDLLSRVTFTDTAPLEQALIDRFQPAKPPLVAAEHDSLRALPAADLIVPAAFTPGRLAIARPWAAQDISALLPVERRLPSLAGATEWLNGPPLSAESLRGKVVLVNIWTFACINCRHVLPYVKAWAEKYRDAGLVVIGVHTPELAFEKVSSNVRSAVARLGITYPVAIDTHSTIWQAFDNQYWPANYFVDRDGRVRYHHFGEEDYHHSEDVIRQLLSEAGAGPLPDGYVSIENGRAFADR